MNSKLIIFDLDGTLYKTEEISLSAVRKAVEDMNLGFPGTERIKSFFGKPMEEFCISLFPECSVEDISKVQSLIRNYERELIPEKGELYPGIKELLNELIDLGYILAICSNGSKEYIKLVLSISGIEELFSCIKGREEGKTKSDLIKEIIDEIKPSQTLVVGDTLDDINAARKNMLPCISVTYGYGGDEISFNNFITESPNEILNNISRFSIFNEIENEIVRNTETRKMIIGVNGVDTSGKTQFSSQLANFLKSKGYKVCLINIDDFHNPSGVRRQGKNEIDAYINNAFNLDYLVEELLIPMRQGNLVDKELKLLDLETDEYSKNKHFYIDNETIVIVEGVLLYRNPINDYFDYRIFLDIPFSEVLNRARVRDVPIYGEQFLERYKNKYIPIQKKYIKEYGPIQNSNMVIDNIDYNRPKIIS